MTTRNRINFSEKQATLIWQQIVGKELPSVEGEHISVMYPGRASCDGGPDFQDAIIANKSQRTRGDVEVHVRSSDWYGHEHHADARYNNVILHVVMWHDCSSATLLQTGKVVAMLCLAKALRHQAYLLPYRLPCFQILDRMDRRTLEKLLNAVGQERFGQKAMHFQDQILRPDKPGEAGQVLFKGLMTALGYARNTRPFEELADRMPLNVMEFSEGLPLKKALLLGTAGLLPSQRRQGNFARGPALSLSKEKEVQELEQIWRSAGKKAKTMRERDWNFSHIYPNNSPVRRIVALSYLLERYRAEGLLAGILRLVKEAPARGGYRVLENGLTVAGDGYWRDHFDFDVRSRTNIPPTKSVALLGNSKAGGIVVNVVLPFAFSWGKMINEPELTEKAVELFGSYPGLAENETTRHMAKQLCLTGPSDFTACHQQGLIHLFKSYCREGRCSDCPLVKQAS